MKKSMSRKDTSWGSTKKRDQYTIVLEDLRSQFKVFGEHLILMGEKFDRNINEVRLEIAKINQNIAVLNQRITAIEERIDKLEARISKLEVHISQLEQANLELLKEIRNNKIEGEVKALRVRVEMLEKKLAHN